MREKEKPEVLVKDDVQTIIMIQNKCWTKKKLYCFYTFWKIKKNYLHKIKNIFRKMLALIEVQ